MPEEFEIISETPARAGTLAMNFYERIKFDLKTGKPLIILGVVVSAFVIIKLFNKGK